MNVKRSTLALLVAGALSFGVAGQAAAGAYAGAYLLIEDLAVRIIDSGTTTPSTSVQITSFDFTLTNTATLNGDTDAVSTTCGGTVTSNDCGVSPALDADPANATGGTVTRVNNVFNFFGPGTDTYSNSDSVIGTAQLTSGLPTSTEQIAESEVQDDGTGRSNAEITSNTGFVVNFTIDSDTADLILTFDATPFMQVDMNDPDFVSGTVQANLEASFSLSFIDPVTGLNSTLSSFSPADLNGNISGASNGTALTYDPGSASYTFRVDGLVNGSYSIAFNALTSTTVRLDVERIPEPATLALLGLGLVGMGSLVARRRRLMG